MFEGIISQWIKVKLSHLLVSEYHIMDLKNTCFLRIEKILRRKASFDWML